MNEWVKVLKAADAAAHWHINQRRKGAGQEPYINHLIEVASFVAEATEGKDPHLVIAALLHDAIEDVKIPRELIAEQFGEDVASLVVEVTDDKSLPKPERKRLQIETAPKKSPRAKLLKLADKVSNLKSVEVSPPAHWPAQRRLDYVAWAKAVVAALGDDVDPSLKEQFVRAADRAELAARSQ
jgi:guanosine-3',5'-bis(diphosphate) 3'-pyrophosphohydrolase